MTLQTQINQILSDNTALQEAVSKSTALLQLADQKIAGLENRLTPEALPELKEIQLISLSAQAEIYEQLHENMLILFQAVAEIYEFIEAGGAEE